MKILSAGRVSLFLLLGFAWGVCAEDAYFTFGGDTPGIGRLHIEGNSIASVEVVELGFPIKDPYKLAFSGESNVVAASVGGKDEPALVLVPVEGGTVLSVALPAELSDVVASGDRFLVAASKGLFVSVDAGSGTVLSDLNARKELTPPGRKGEHIFPLPDGKSALVSFQKDDDNSPATGNRIVLLGLDPLSVKSDLLLERNKPELHIEGNPKEQGPGPEVVTACPGSNTLVVSLDLYGALAFADLDAALRGKLNNLAYVPTSADGAWGNSFPDRATLLPSGNKEYLLVSNASKNGGLALIDVATRTVLQHLPVEAGCEAPLVFENPDVAATIVSGKIKSRGEEALEKSAEPGTRLLLINYQGLAEGKPVTLEEIDLGFATRRITKAGDGLVAVFGDEEVVLFDVKEKTIADRKPLPGPVVRALGLTR